MSEMLKKVRNAINNINQSEVDEFYYEYISNSIGIADKLKKAKFKILSFDNKEKLINDTSLDFDYENIKEFIPSTKNSLPPYHHLWILVCSNIKAHDIKTSKRLDWVQKLGQKGFVIITHTTDDLEQLSRAEEQIKRCFDGKHRVLFTKHNFEISEIILSPLQAEEYKENSTKLLESSISKILYQKSDILCNKIESRINKMQVLISNLQQDLYDKREVVNLFSEKLEKRLDGLKEESPAFDWISALSEGMISNTLERFTKVEKEEDHKEKKGTESNKNEKNDESYEPDVDQIVINAKEECFIRIKEHIKNSFRDHLGFEYLKAKGNLTSDSSSSNKILDDISNFLDINIKHLEISSNDIFWPLNDDLISELTKTAIEKIPMQKKIILQVVKYLVKIKAGAISPAVINELLDNWGIKVYHATLNQVKNTLNQYIIKLSNSIKQDISIISNRLKEFNKIADDLDELFKVIAEFKGYARKRDK